MIKKEEPVKQNKILEFIRKEPVTFVSGILALASVFIVHPDKEYLGYIHQNFRVKQCLYVSGQILADLEP